VSQVAGKLQGLAAGDLGDLGDASLSLRQLNSILELVMANNLKHASDDIRLSSFRQTQLELTAKLFACAQRLYLGNAEWSLLGDPTEALVSLVRDEDHVEDYLRLPLPMTKRTSEVCSVSTMAKSPFVRHVLAPLYRSTPTPVSSADTPLSTVEFRSQESPGRNGRYSADKSHPLLREINLIDERADAKVVVPLLQVICAAAEVFPTGSCWTSRCQTAWHKLPAVEAWGSSPISVLVGSPGDIGVVIDIVSNVLLSSGGSGGDAQEQRWALLCLLKLTKATSVQSSIRPFDAPGLSSLQNPWRCVWSILFRSDQRYLASTKQVAADSVGDLVILLLDGIVRNFCTDPGVTLTSPVQQRQSTFVHSRQEDLWKLPVFWDPERTSSSSCFTLIQSVLYSVGLSESGSDAICLSVPNAQYSCPEAIIAKRRFKLIYFCLRSLSSKMSSETFVAAVSFSMAHLIHGSAECHGTNWDCYRDRRQIAVTDMERESITLSCRSKFSSWCHLWREPPVSVPRPEKFFFIDEISSDSVKTAYLTMQQRLLSEQNSSVGADFISTAHSEALLGYAFERLDPVNVQQVFGPHDIATLDGCDGAEGSPTGKEFPLSLAILSMKVILTIALRQKSTRESLILRFQNELSEIFQRVASVAESAPENDEMAMEVFSSIWQVTCSIAEARSESMFQIPSPIVDAVKPLCVTIQNLLEDYSKFGDDTENFVVIQTSRPSLVDDDWMKSDDDESVASDRLAFRKGNEYEPAGSKRKLSEIQEKENKRAKSGGRACISLSQRCAFLLSSVLVSMDPSAEACELVARALLGVDDLSDYGEVEVDVAGGLFACQILCVESVISNDSVRRQDVIESSRVTGVDSAVTLICYALHALRDSEIADASLYSLSLQLCSTLVSLAEDESQEVPITSMQADLVSDILLKVPNRNWVKLRPDLRATQVRAATVSFLEGKDNFHAVVDKTYPGFVLSFLSDEDGVVRRQASLAILAAVRYMSETAVIDSIQRRLPPLSVNLPEEGARKAFRQWLDMVKDQSIADGGRSAADDQVWEDAFHSVQFGIIFCWEKIAGSTPTNDVIVRVLFDLIKLSCSRPGLEMLSFQVADRIAISLGYSGAEDLVDAEHESLVRSWLDAKLYGLLDLPLLLSSPGILRRFVALGRRPERENLFDLDAVRAAAASDFLVRCRYVTVPLILSHSISNLDERSSPDEIGRHLLEDRFMSDFCAVFDDKPDVSKIKRLLKKQIPDIIAYQVMLASGDDSGKAAAAKMAMLLKTLLSGEVVQRQGERNASGAIRRFLDMTSKWLARHRDISESADLCTLAILTLVEEYGSSDSDSADLFRRVCATSTEFLVFAKYRLAENHGEFPLRKRYVALESLSELLVQQLSIPKDLGLQVGFYVSTLSGLLFDESLSSIHPLIVNTMKNLVAETASRCEKSRILKDELKLVAQDLLCTCMGVHERCQRFFISKCLQVQRRKQRTRIRGLGFLGTQDTHSKDTSGQRRSSQSPDQDYEYLREALLYEGKVLDEGLTMLLVGTFEIIEIIVRNMDCIGLDSSVFAGVSPPYETPESHRTLLSGVNKSFNAQSLLADVLDEPGVFSPVIRFVANPPIEDNRPSPTTQRILRAELRELEKFLRNGGSHSFNDIATREEFVRSLALYCGSQYQDEVRIVASRCLGEIRTHFICSQASSDLGGEVDDQIGLAIRKGHLELALFSRAAEDLVRGLKFADDNTSVVALETLKAVVSCGQGTEWRKYFTDEISCRLLSTFLGSRQLELRPFSLFLSDREIEGLREKARRICGGELEEEQWCWNDRLWRSGALPQTSFDDWICCLVPSILILCYPRVSHGSPNDVADLKLRLPLCQRMACVDPGFARSLFLSIVLDLLANKGERMDTKSDYVDGVLEDTYVGQRGSHFNVEISRCFSALFKTFNSSDDFSESLSNDSRAVKLVLDTLDKLRRLTQLNFVSSTHHRKNRAARRSKGSGDSDTSQDVSQSPTNGDPPKWRGVPFGTVVRLDGLLVSRVCLRARRPASAIFFAEMYADARFGGSASAATKLSDMSKTVLQLHSSPDISGFEASLCDGSTESEYNGIHTDCMEFLNLLQESYAVLTEDDAVSAVEKHITDLTFSLDQSPPVLSDSHNDFEHSLADLQQLDTAASRSGESARVSLSTASCLQGLGLSNVSKAYIQGILSFSGSFLGSPDGEALREKWFESSLELMKWNEEMFAQSTHETTTFSGIPWATATAAGFHERIFEAVHLLVDDDFESCRVKLNDARKLIIPRVSSVVHAEIPLGSVYDCIDRLQALNELDCVVSSSFPLRKALAVYCGINWNGQSPQREALLTTPLNTSVISASRGDFSESLAELTLRSMRARAQRESREPESSMLLDGLVSELWHVSSADYDQGLPERAMGALDRLHALTRQSPSHNGNPISLLNLRLHEARVQELRGDFAGAIRQAKQIGSRLSSEIEPSTDRDCLLSEAFVACGRWMGKHKVEPAESVLRTYLDPGAKAAMSVYESEKNNRNSNRAMVALLELAQLSSNLFETVSGRVESVEWRKAGKILADRESELKQCDALLKEQLACLKDMAPRSKNSDELRRKHHDTTLYRLQLSRQVENAKRERLKVENSIEDYRELSLQSTVSALSISDTHGREDLSRHGMYIVTCSMLHCG